MKKFLYVSFDDISQVKGASVHIKELTQGIAGSDRFHVTLVTPGEINSTQQLSESLIHHALQVSGENLVKRIVCFRQELFLFLKNTFGNIAFVIFKIPKCLYFHIQ